MKVEGSNVLVTGASSGIGAALARLLAERGATVGLVARRKDRLEEVLADCRKTSPESRLWTADLADVEGAARLVLEAWDDFGYLDVLVNNAGMPKRRHVADVTADDLDETMRVNFFAPVRMSMAVLPKMLERGSGSIVNVSSLGGRLGIKHETAYCASKFALCGWSESMAIDLWNEPVDVRLIIPGAIDTEIWDKPTDEPPLYDGPKEPPETVAEGIVAAIEGGQFEHYLPDMKGIVEYKTTSADEFLAGASAM